MHENDHIPFAGCVVCKLYIPLVHSQGSASDPHPGAAALHLPGALKVIKALWRTVTD